MIMKKTTKKTTKKRVAVHGFDSATFAKLGGDARKAFSALKAIDTQLTATAKKHMDLCKARDVAVEKHRALVRELESRVTGLRWNPANARYEPL